MECFRAYLQPKTALKVVLNGLLNGERILHNGDLYCLQAMGEVADKAESLQNLFNCTVPLISSVSVLYVWIATTQRNQTIITIFKRLHVPDHLYLQIIFFETIIF